MSRAALLTTLSGFVTPRRFLDFWYAFYKTYWRDEVDELRVVEWPYMEGSYGHGRAMRQLLLQTKCDYVMLIEDDFYIYKPGFVDRYFRYLENGLHDIIGSPRSFCTPGVERRAAERFGVMRAPQGDTGVAFWPCFFFAKREDLLHTYQEFGKHVWDKGEYIHELDLYTEQEERGDTFFYASMQLRRKLLRVRAVGQMRARMTDKEDYQRGEWNWHPDSGYIHAGSLCKRPTDSDGGPEIKEDLDRRRFLWDLIAEGKNTDPVRFEMYRKILRAGYERIGL